MKALIPARAGRQDTSRTDSNPRVIMTDRQISAAGSTPSKAQRVDPASDSSAGGC
jgi:hypothetical protein